MTKLGGVVEEIDTFPFLYNRGDLKTRYDSIGFRNLRSKETAGCIVRRLSCGNEGLRLDNLSLLN